MTVPARIKRFARICRIIKKRYFCAIIREISSVGSEHYLDKVGVTGSSPVFPTTAL